MKTFIKISGGIQSVSTIRKKLTNYVNFQDQNFNTVFLKYDTMKEAKQDIKKAFKELRNEAKDEGHSTQHITKSKCNTYFSYDAGTAEILTDKIF